MSQRWHRNAGSTRRGGFSITCRSKSDQPGEPGSGGYVKLEAWVAIRPPVASEVVPWRSASLRHSAINCKTPTCG